MTMRPPFATALAPACRLRMALGLLALQALAWPAVAQPGWVHLPPRHVTEPATRAQLRPEHQPLSGDPATRWLQTRWRGGVGPADLQTVHVGGTAAQALDLLLVADGFTAAERDTFFAAADATSAALLAWSPYGDYASLINVHALFVASAQSGASHPAQNTWVDNAFGTTYDYGGLARLAVADDGKVIDAALQALPEYDIAIVLVNDSAYGGSGGAVPVVSLHAEAIGILRHELGHNLAHLADEYTAPYPGYPAGDSEPNVAAATHLNPPKWHDWIDDSTPVPTPPSAVTGLFSPLGAYEGARYEEHGIYRPAPNCLMRTLDMAFCPICAEALVVALHKQTTMLRGVTPALAADVTCTVGQCPQFSAEVAAIATLVWHWRVDDVDVATSPSWTPGAGEVGDHTVELQLRDETDSVRTDPKDRLLERATWQLHVTAGATPPAEVTPAADAASAPDLAAADCGDCDEAPAEPEVVKRRARSGCTAGAPAPGHGLAVLGLVAALQRRRSRWARNG